MKPKQHKNQNQTGFTLLELVVVIAIMALLTVALMVDFNRQKVNRNLVLAKNETVTNLRKTQSYMLSSKNIATNLPAKFYVAKFVAGSGSYTVSAVDNQYAYHDIENINLPSGVTFTSLTTAAGVSHACVQVIFSAPFGNVYVRGSSTCTSAIASILKDPVQLAALSQGTIYLNFRALPTSSNGKYVQINPLTGQFSAN